ncbi:lipoate---protein ligase [Anaerolineales bacterium]|nr:lipoate---protein ligase [Anaerolineales bacterium]
MTTWRLLRAPAATGAWNMAVDESILEHIYRGESKPTLRLYSWNPPCLSLGHAQPFADVDMERLKSHGWDVVRRATGGRAILHTDELTYSVTGREDDPVLVGGILESYNRIAQALMYAARELGLPVEMKEYADQPATKNSNPVCFEVPATYEITVNGKKLIGSAQARKKEGVLQHGSLPLAGDLTRICQALVFKDEAAREVASQRLLARATTVESILNEIRPERHLHRTAIDAVQVSRRTDTLNTSTSLSATWETAAQAFARGFEVQLGISFESGALSPSEEKRAAELVEKKYAHPSWTEKS